MIRNLGLLDIEIVDRNVINIEDFNEVSNQNSVGGLVGKNSGTVIGSYAHGEIRSGEGTAPGFSIGIVGGLVGWNTEDGAIYNSHAVCTIEIWKNLAGGLVGLHQGEIGNSYAAGVISRSSLTGGLIGRTQGQASVYNSYADNFVSGSGSVGGLVGSNLSGVYKNIYSTAWVLAGDRQSTGGIGGFNTGTQFTNIYSISRVDRGGSMLGGFSSIGVLENSYANSDISSLPLVASLSIGVFTPEIKNSFAFTTAELQSGTAQSGSASDVYYNWSDDDWDFGNVTQYPVLRYAQSTGTGVMRACDSDGLPVCGDVIPRQALSELRTGEGKGQFASPFVFDPRYRSHTGVIENLTPVTQLVAVSANPNAQITFIYFDERQEERGRSRRMTGRATSAEIKLNANDASYVVIEVITPGGAREPGGVDWYHLSLTYQFTREEEFDDDMYISINTLEDLNTIRDTPNFNYRLTRHLDFNDPNSYATGAINRAWTVEDFGDIGDLGWTPIGTQQAPFTGTFDGKGYVISNLQINTTATSQGLFGSIGNGGTVRNLGLSGAKIEGGNNVGILVGEHRGTINNSHTTGTVSALGNVGGLAGYSIGGGIIINSHTNVEISASGRNAGGMVGSCDGCTIQNSFAVGSVAGVGNDADVIGGFVGRAENIFNFSNNYAWSNVSGGDTQNGIGNGGFIALPIFNGQILNANYSTGMTDGGFYGRVPQFNADPRIEVPNYWNTDTDGAGTSQALRANVVGITARQMQLSPPQLRGPSDIYYLWSSDDWDFGNDSQYPILKYSAGPDNDACDTLDTPKCGTLIEPQIREDVPYGLRSLVARYAQLNPPFDVSVQQTRPYFGTVENDIAEFELVATAMEATATYSVYLGGSQTPLYSQIESGEPSGVISLVADDIIEVVIEVNGTYTVRYTLYLDYTQKAPIDADHDGLVDLSYLEDIAMLIFNFRRDGTPTGTEIGYRPTRDGVLNTLGCPNGYVAATK